MGLEFKATKRHKRYESPHCAFCVFAGNLLYRRLFLAALAPFAFSFTFFLLFTGRNDPEGDDELVQ